MAKSSSSSSGTEEEPSGPPTLAEDQERRIKRAEEQLGEQPVAPEGDAAAEDVERKRKAAEAETTAHDLKPFELILMAGQVWDWPNQQVVRVDVSGPGWDTPCDSASAYITYGNAGRDFEFLLRLSTGGPVTGHGTVTWDFGDGVVVAGVDSATPATHTYATPGTYAVQATIGAAYRSVTVVAPASGGKV